MDLGLTKEQVMLKKMVRELAAREIAPIAAEIDETGRFPGEVVEKMADAGLFGILIPSAFGGMGGDRLDLVLVIEEIAAASASVAWSFVRSTVVGSLILAFGSDEQRRTYLPALAKGERLGAISVVEPSGGTTGKRPYTPEQWPWMVGIRLTVSRTFAPTQARRISTSSWPEPTAHKGQRVSRR